MSYGVGVGGIDGAPTSTCVGVGGATVYAAEFARVAHPVSIGLSGTSVAVCAWADSCLGTLAIVGAATDYDDAVVTSYGHECARNVYSYGSEICAGAAAGGGSYKDGGGGSDVVVGGAACVSGLSSGSALCTPASPLWIGLGVDIVDLIDQIKESIHVT